MMLCQMTGEQQVMHFVAGKETDSLIGKNKGTVAASEENSAEYNEAQEILHKSHEELRETIYNLVLIQCNVGRNKECLAITGSDFVMDRIDYSLKEWGY